jgi:uncharacterized protein YcaQ
VWDVIPALSAAEARRAFLAAQGLSSTRPKRAVHNQDFAAYLAVQGVLQLDTVNVLARAHYLPIFSRHGAYDTQGMDDFLWGHPTGHSATCFEHWGHEASVMPRELLPAMHHRMRNDSSWKHRTRADLERERPGLLQQVREMVDADGPLVGADLEHLAPRQGPKGQWWDAGHTKVALEYLFITGAVAASRGRHFARTYDACERAWGLPPSDAASSWGLPTAVAQQELFDRGLSATGIGTVKDICDHFRLQFQPGPKTAGVGGGKAWAASAVERGLAEWVSVDGWSEPALLAVGGPSAVAPWHRGAAVPSRATGAALLSPFDPVCWFRPRLERMFGMDYRIEIYTPASKRLYGYYTLPFLLGDQMVGRLDLKADRKARVLRVEAAWREETVARGARRRSDDDVAAAMAIELETMRGWLGLEGVTVAQRGNLAADLAAATATAV